jgi:excisionase family DNA binding protein
MSSWLTVAAVAEELGVSPRTVHRWIGAGELEALRLPGGRLRIPESALSAWIQVRMTRSGERSLGITKEEVR